MKTLTVILPMALCLALGSCADVEMAPKRLYNRDGVWLIESIQTTLYDTLGNILNDNIVLAPGELVLFKSESIDLLYGYRQGICLVYSLGQGHPMNYYMDGERAHITDMEPSDPLGISRVWTIEEKERKQQVWTHIEMHPDGASLPFSMSNKTELRLKAINAY